MSPGCLAVVSLSRPRERHRKKNGNQKPPQAESEVQTREPLVGRRLCLRARLLYLCHPPCAPRKESLRAVRAPRNTRGRRRTNAAAPPRTLHHSGSARVAKPAPLFFPNLHHCRPAPNGPWRLTSRSGPILPAGSRATRPIKAAAPVRPHFDGGAGRTRPPSHHCGGGGERPLTWPYGYRGGAALPRDTLLPSP